MGPCMGQAHGTVRACDPDTGARSSSVSTMLNQEALQNRCVSGERWLSSGVACRCSHGRAQRVASTHSHSLSQHTVVVIVVLARA